MWNGSYLLGCLFLTLNIYLVLAAPPVHRDPAANPPLSQPQQNRNINNPNIVNDRPPANNQQQNQQQPNNQQPPNQQRNQQLEQNNQNGNQQQRGDQNPQHQQAQQEQQYQAQDNNQHRQHQAKQQAQQPVKPDTVLADHPSCVQDVQRLCHNNDQSKNEKQVQHNFEVLDCFMSYKGDDEPPSAACQTVIYNYKRQLTEDARFEDAAKEVCKELIEETKVNTDCQHVATGGYLPCLMEAAAYADQEKDSNKNCFTFLTKIERVIFSDYHLVHKFQEDCMAEINEYKCGRLWDNDTMKEENVKHHNQGPVIECLMKQVDHLHEKCKKQILRVSELQAEDFHMDRPLFFACRADRDKFCDNVESGNGRVYRCLMDRQPSGDLDPKCVAQLIKREKLIQEDAKADATFFHACHDLLKKTDCMPDPDHPDEIKSMSETLICMMDAEAEADEKFDIPPACEIEITAFQSNLMNEYKISAEIVSQCHEEITIHCGVSLKKAHHKDGTVHCLMALAMPTNHLKEEGKEKKISPECKAAVTNLLDETRPASVLGIDGFLVEQCAVELNQHCKEDKLQLDCLMDHIHNGKIDFDSDCARHLLELEYFISRNYKHDMQLVKACHKTIKSHKLDHHLKKDEQGPPSDGLVFAQLYKLTREQLSGNPITGEPIAEECVEEVLRCVRERAVSIDLNPELEEACLPYLTSMCKDAQHGEELGCLEEHWKEIPPSNDPKNNPGCHELLAEYIEAQDEDYQLDFILMKACEPAIKKHCEDVLQGIKDGEIDEGEIIECLIDHKFDKDMDKKCFAGIEHHQIVNMQDFKFTAKFRDSCKKDFEEYCKNAKSKPDVVYCLSAVVRNDTLLEDKHRVSKKCRAQLKVEFLALEDTIQMDPDFEKACEKDLKKHCEHVTPHPDADSTDLFLTCIRAVDSDSLTHTCSKYVFKVVELANAIAGASSHIFRQCKSEIKKYCRNHVDDPDKLLNCLDEHYEESSTKCQNALNEEEEEDNEDIRLNPALYMPCKSDIKEFCSKEMNRVHDNDDRLHGAVINCLKLEYVKGAKSGLSESCGNQMHLLVVKVQTRDYKQDYVLTHQCKKEIKECSKDDTTEEKHILECLKEKLFKGDLKDDPECQAEVFRLITENRVDIHTDGELHDACKSDLQESLCKTVTAGSGRIMSCLLSIYEAGTIKSPRCKELVKKRKELWEHAAKLSPPETLRQVWDDMSSSHSRWYFLCVISGVLIVMLVVGIFCGRATKRVAAEIKNR